MSEIADRIPGEIIIASYSNTLRDRVVQRYTDATQRAAQSPVPGLGEVSYLTGSGQLQIFNGTSWVNFPDQPDYNALVARLDTLEAIRDSFDTEFTAGTTSIGTSVQNITGTVQAATPGLYLIDFNADLALTTAGQTGLGGITIGLTKNGSQIKGWGSFGVRHNDADDAPVEVEWPASLYWLETLAAGDNMQFTALRTATFSTAGEASDRRISIRRVS